MNDDNNLINQNVENKIISETDTASFANDVIEASKETNTVFDFAIYDEAHKTVGKNYKKFSLLVPDEHLKKFL